MWVNFYASVGIVHYDTSAMKRFLTSVSLQHEPKASDVITLVKKMFFRTSIVRNFISRGVKMRTSARQACVKPHLRTRSDINSITAWFNEKHKIAYQQQGHVMSDASCLSIRPGNCHTAAQINTTSAACRTHICGMFINCGFTSTDIMNMFHTFFRFLT